MKRPKSYSLYKKDKARHKYDMTYEAHQECKAYERYCEQKKEELDYSEVSSQVLIQKVNGVVVSVTTSLTAEEALELSNFLNSKK